MKIINDVKFLVVGLGLIGGSYAQALSDLGYEVGAVTRSQSSIDYAKEKGIIAHGTTEVTEEYISQFDVVIFSLYPKVLLDWVEKYQGYLKPNALLTDVTGVKGSVVNTVQNMLPEGVEFISAHPMAGREQSGVEFSDPRVFLGANYIVTPTEKNSKEAIEICCQLGKDLGFSRISELTIDEHDKMIAFLSQLTHCIAVSLMTCNEEEGLERYTGDSFRDLTRIAKINEKMWSELFLMNKEPLLSEMDKFIKEFSLFRDMIANGERENLQEKMKKATIRRAYFDKPKAP